MKANHKKWIGGLLVGILLILLAWLLFYRWYQPATPTTIDTINQDTIVTITADPWLLVTDTVTIAVTPQSEQSVCNVTWLDNTAPTDLTFYTVTTTGEQRILVYTAEPCSIAEDISALPYVGVTLDGAAIGGLQPPNLPYSGVMAPVLPNNPTTVYPTSGYWRYTMTAAANNLNCDVTTFGTFGGSGQVQLTMSNYGFTADLITDTAAIHLYRLQYQATDYESPAYTFPLIDGYGEVQWRFTALDQDHMAGTLQVTGDRCVGEYPLTLDLEIPTVPPIYIPTQGSWTMNYGPMVCGATVLSTALFNLPSGMANLAVTGGGPLPMDLSFSGVPSSLQLIQSIDTNQYSSFSNLYLGTAIDPATNLPFTLLGTMYATALSESQLVGTLVIQGTNGCVAAGFVEWQQS